MGCNELTTAGKTYSRRLAGAMVLYVLALFLAEAAMKHTRGNMPATLALAVVPSLPIVAVLVIIALYLREERDEFQRDMTMQTLLWGMGGTLGVATVYGFVEQFTHAPHFPAYWVFVLFWLFTGTARMVYWARFRGGRDDE
jgi:hypothetical protein